MALERIGPGIKLLRAGEWWEYKLIPLLALFYATLTLSRQSVAAHVPSLLLLLVALSIGAAYVSVINDLADRDDDRRGGKPNRVDGAPRWLPALTLAVALGGGVAFAWYWHDRPALAGCYVASWVAFALYSLPPVRLKHRGVAGVVADAAGSSLLPALFAALLAFDAAGETPRAAWLAAVAAWSFGFGVRGILWHQIGDEAADRLSGIGTFVCRRSADSAARVGAWFALPMEVGGLAALLWLLGTHAPLIALLLYCAILPVRAWRFSLPVFVVRPRGDGIPLLHEYYALYLPIALLIGQLPDDPRVGFVLLGQLLLFPRPWLQAAHEVRFLGKRASRRSHRAALRLAKYGRDRWLRPARLDRP